MANPFTIVKTVALPATPEQVWHAVATREGQRAWSPDPDAVEAPGTQVDREENRRFAVRTPTEANGAFHAFEYVVQPQADGTSVLRFEHSGDLGEDWAAPYDYEAATSGGWDMYLHTLTQYLTYFAGRPATLVHAQGPDVSAVPEAWPRLLAALGLDGRPDLGTEVVLRPEGLDELRGVVDFEVPDDIDFLAVRTDLGLFRFHGMAMMGLPVAVGHYIYADADAEALGAAWEAWLARVYA
jgi:hypothetical protein